MFSGITVGKTRSAIGPDTIIMLAIKPKHHILTLSDSNKSPV